VKLKTQGNRSIASPFGHRQLAARLSKAGPARLRKRSDALSSLYVMVRLTRAAKGKGSIPKELNPAIQKRQTYLKVVWHSAFS
jgi:hypothetical protein